MRPAPFRCHGVPAAPDALRRLRHDLMAWVLAAGVDEDRAADIVLASYEALANVADHAYDDTAPGVVDIDAAVHPGRLEVVITDHGQWRTPVPDPRPVSLRGRGLLLLRASADRADITSGDSGTVVTLTWDLDRMS
ncbi:Anti-sigma regulatory factor (Ser/Thr protein kinase) [Amycolatopsis tolypomycina]|uniref:Anti-sigma regulatory factor (Ser/Thr protein kinase) n=1 Tax=Amycolatopsis tolypomycina TaxID=208445 RepID=A0A1H5B054_9PSEU|nr:ATP-binding protein [Amycolatopsis tolypomycina]SED48099.1 Anti-sigma regulatory factor (Ser/Thr protein kinase) [Amycolatopsis tolypomycina]